jgi:hypothetical protein
LLGKHAIGFQRAALPAADKSQREKKNEENDGSHHTTAANLAMFRSDVQLLPHVRYFIKPERESHAPPS